MFQSTTITILLILRLEHKTWKLGQQWVFALQMVVLYGIYLNKKLPCVVTLDVSKIYLIHKVGRTCKVFITHGHLNESAPVCLWDFVWYPKEWLCVHLYQKDPNSSALGQNRFWSGRHSAAALPGLENEHNLLQICSLALTTGGELG